MVKTPNSRNNAHMTRPEPFNRAHNTKPGYPRDTPQDTEQDHHDELMLRLKITACLVKLEHDGHRLLNAFPGLDPTLRLQLRHLVMVAAPTAENLIKPLIDGEA